MACGEPGTVRTPDGTTIGWFRTGQGPPMVLVHGSTADHTRWAPVLEQLAATYTVYAIDRRGRGASPDQVEYTVAAEFDDVAAVVDAIDEPVILLGHSFGGLCALEGATRTTNLAKLILYEPVFDTGGTPIAAADVMERVAALLEAGEREAALITFMREVVGLTDETLDLMRNDPSWQGRIAAAHTLLREDEVEGSHRFDPARFEQLTVPTLLLVGSESPPGLTEPSAVLARVLPDARVATLEGQAHVAMNTAPELFVRAVKEFLAA